MRILRFSSNGDDITDMPELWSVTDTEVCSTNYPHPTITSGQHTNGPRTNWMRQIGGEWVPLREKSMHKVGLIVAGKRKDCD